MKFSALASVNFQGMVVAFARGDMPVNATGDTGIATNIYFNVLALQVDSGTDADDWSGFRPLRLPDAVRPAGMNMINVPVQYKDGGGLDDLRDADQPFRVLTNQEYIYIFRQSVKGSLLVNLLRLVREAAPGNTQEVSYALQPAWEVRYQRSEKPDTPADARDTQDYLSPEKLPFVEPAFELFMIAGLIDGNFDVQFLPRADGTLLSCTIVVARAASNQVDVHEIPMDSFGLFSLAGKQFKDGVIAPDSSFTLSDETGAVATLSGAPAAVFYLKQERIRNKDNRDFAVKRSGRLLLVQNITLGSAATTCATLDVGVSADGTLARPGASLVMDPVGVANYTMSFDAGAWVGFPDWVVGDKFSMEMWIFPTSADVPLQQIIGHTSAADAPFLRLRDGTSIEVGFTGKNGKPLVAATAPGSVRQRAWTHVQISFDTTFSIVLNGFPAACTQDGGGDTPAAVAINAVSLSGPGFIGCVDQLTMYADAGWPSASAVNSFAFDTIEYRDKAFQPIDPPLTPNVQNPAAPGQVHGAHLVPSTSPVGTSAGALSWDVDGLSIYAGYFKDLATHTELRSSPALLAGADGLIHVYFKGSSDAFSVMRLDTETARAVFEGNWSTAAPTAESGRLQFIANQAGAFMNAASVAITASTDPAQAPLFCHVTLVSPSGVTETWSGMPRSVLPFCAVLAGDSVSDPADQRVANRTKVYFDDTGTRSAAYLALANNANAAALALVSRARQRLPLATVKIDAAGATCALTLTFNAPRWSGAAVTATWTHVPMALDAFLNTLSGLSTSYQYASKEAMNVASYSLVAASGLVAANRVVLFVKAQAGEMQALTIAQGANQDCCDVTMTLGALQACWTSVPRAQVAFGVVIEGSAPPEQYDYATLASGDYAALGASLIISTDGAAALLQDASLGGIAPVVPDDDLRVSASLFAAFVTENYDAGAMVPATGVSIAASTFQHAAMQGGSSTFAYGSTLFRAMPLTLPHLGAAAAVQDTTAQERGVAPLSLQGYNGGWLNQPEQRALRYDWTSYVGFDVDSTSNPGIAALAIPGDMSLELWCRPERASEDPLQQFQRLLTFNCPAPGSAAPIQYMAGLRDCPSVACVAGTRIFTGFDATTATLYTWFNPVALAAGIIGSIATKGTVDPILTLTLDATGKVSLGFALDTTQPPIVSTIAVAANSWHQLAAGVVITRKTVNFKLLYTLVTTLIVDGVAQGGATYTVTRDLELPLETVAMVLGDIVAGNGLPMLVNETAFFARLLVTDEIEQFFEQRIPANTPGLIVKWNFLEGSGARVINSAVTGSAYDADISPSAAWSDFGLYARPLLGHGQNIASLTHEPVIHGWTHLALVHQAGYAIALQGGDYANCGNDGSLGLGDAFSLEAWIRPDVVVTPAPQTVMAKGAEYRLSLDASGRPCFAVLVTIDDTQQVLAVRADNALSAGVPVHLAARFEVLTRQVASGDKFDIVYEAHLHLFVNGKQVAWGMQAADGTSYLAYQKAVQRVVSTAALNLGRSPLAQGSAYLQGAVADVRLWSRLLSDAEIMAVYASRRPPPDANGMIAWWHFDERSGRTAFDAKGDNNATLSNGNLRIAFDATTVNTFYVNGHAATQPDFIDSPDAVGGYGTASQFSFARADSFAPTGFYGQLAEVRIWNGQRTGEQIADAMFHPAAGNEPDLRGCWNFGNGSGKVVEDRTGRGNTGILRPDSSLPVWRISTVPLSDESPSVIDIFGGVPTYAQQDISERPSVIDYADLQRDAYGTPFSVMKRAYLSVYDGAAHLLAGFKVGDLDTVYLGQAQSKPTLIGFIEGAPPIPSENQTLPYWLGGYGDSNSYAGATDVSFTDAENTVYAYNASRDTSDTHAFSMKGGLYAGGQYSISAGIGIEVETPVMVFEGHLGAQGGFTLTDHKSDGIDTQSGTATNLTTGLKPGGAWEPGTNAADWVNPVVGRRYVPNNNGLALVKSLTVDVYASILRRTGSMVKMSMAPNPDIPADVNLIDFPIAPGYIKNGTLDGKVGLRNDPDYPNADLARGSYFKPLEAYALKRRIEHEQTTLEAYYQQYDTASYAGKLGSVGGFNDYRSSTRNNSAYDWSEHLSKRSIANTYVWTAGGGSFSEQSEPMNVYAEQHGAISATSWSAGAVGDIQMAFPVAGFYLDFDYLYSSATEVNVVKNKEQSSGFALAAAASPDSYLYAPVIKGDQVSFGNAPTEGKVDGYRYMAFMLAPHADNGTDFFDTVVDPNWLANSKDSSAAALRDASMASVGPWRVLYRVTYVSRIPPKFQPVPAETRAPDVRLPANLAYNTLLVQLVQQQTGSTQPDPLAIGSAIGKVLGTVAVPGLLDLTLPWWRQFMVDSSDYTLPAAAILRALREDLLQYMLALYAAQAITEGA